MVLAMGLACPEHDLAVPLRHFGDDLTATGACQGSATSRVNLHLNEQMSIGALHMLRSGRCVLHDYGIWLEIQMFFSFAVPRANHGSLS